MDREVKSLLLLCSGRSGEMADSTSENDHGYGDIGRVLDLAVYHGIFPVIYETLAEKGMEMGQEYVSLYRKIRREGMFLSCELSRIITSLRREGVEALPFKGPALSMLAYGDTYSRHSSDLDILIEKKDIRKVISIVSKLGYESSYPVDFTEDSVCMDIMGDIVFLNREKGYNIEFHWRLFEKSLYMRMDTESVFSFADEVDLCTKGIKSFSSEYLIVYLAMHGAKHGWERLKWFCDMDRVVRRGGIDWEEVERIAIESGGYRSLYSILYACRELLETPLPKMVEEIVDREEIADIGRYSIRMVIRNLDGGAGGIGEKIELQRYRLSVVDSSPHPLTYTVRSLMTLSYLDCSVLSLPSYLRFLYYPLRVVRLLRKNLF